MRESRIDRRAVVLVSGGLDSAVCLGVAKGEGYELFALSFDYGQRHKIELEAAAAQAAHFGAQRHVVMPLDLTAFGGSALTDSIAVPKGETGDPIESGIPVTYVPARNTVFLSVALAWAEVLRADAIFIGVNAVDYSGYPDCRPDFIEAFVRLARLATKGGVEGTWALEVRTPLLTLSKGEIVELGMRVGVDFEKTWSCYDPQPIVPGTRDAGGLLSRWRACGRCDSCRLRAAGFAAAGLECE